MKMYRRKKEGQKGEKSLRPDMKAVILAGYKKGKPATVEGIIKDTGADREDVMADIDTLAGEGSVIVFGEELYPKKVIFDTEFMDRAGAVVLTAIEAKEEWDGAGFDPVEIMDEVGMNYKGLVRVLDYLVQKGELVRA